MRLKVTRPNSDSVIGFLIPLCIFIEVGSPILLATSPLAQESLAVPLSFLVMPIVLILGVIRLSKTTDASSHKAYLSGLPFVAYVIVLASTSAIFINPKAIVAGVQWLLPFLWMPYFLSLKSHDFERLARGFVSGVFFSALYYFTAGTLEILQYGVLQDFGRMSQNIILPGQYQVAVYVPTALAYGALISTVFVKNGLVDRSKHYLLALNFFGLVAISFTASREGMLVFLVGHLLVAAIQRRSRIAVSLIAISLFATIIALNLDQLMRAFSESELRLLNKIAALHAAEDQLAGRDDMIINVLQIIRSNTLFGTHFLPPQTFSDRFTIIAPSAHNIYVDAFLWTGFIGGILFIFFSGVFLCQAMHLIIKQIATQSLNMAAGIAVLSVLFIMLSNNINVPWRQPLTAPIGTLMFTFCFRYKRILRL